MTQMIPYGWSSNHKSVDEKRYAVYVHTFPNGKKYVGITSLRPETRWGRNGRCYTRKHNGKYVQPRMANAILKYRWENVAHEILFEGLTKGAAEQKEIELISIYKSNHREYGYNIESGGHSGEMAEETKRKLSELFKGKPKTEEHKKNLSKAMKGVGHPISEEARRKLSATKKGRIVTEASRKKISESRKGKYGGANNPSARRIVQYTKNGDFVKVWDYATQASNALGLHLGNMIQCCRGNLKSCGGFVWRYYEETGGDNT